MAEWRRATLGDIADESDGSLKTGPFGTVFQASEYAPVGTPVVSVGEIRYGSLSVTEKTKRVGPQTLRRLREYLLRQGDLVFGRKGAVDRSAWVKAGEDGYFLGSDAIRVRLGDVVDSRFMAYQVQSPRIRSWIKQHAVGTTLASLNEPILRLLPVVVPPLTEQRAIAATLGALDDKIDSNRRATSLAEALGDAVFASVASSTTRLLDAGTLVMGSSPPGTTYNEEGAGLPFYQGVRDFGARFPSRRVWTTGPIRLSEAGDSLVSVRAPVGRLNRSRELCCIGRGLAAVRSPFPSTLYYALRAAEDLWVPFNQEGTVFGAVNRRDLGNALLAWPGSIESTTKLELTLGATDSKIASLVLESERLAALRDVLLPELLSGRIRAGDLPDPATAPAETR
ncbi:MAG: restriction endonuclease subunit S [Bifidobacteriaceae bacterium]|jgi:type I restriction enzyme S subunit|nr:restriction endonuclease subunit S [Bifidobacteriaceae bacterium]